MSNRLICGGLLLAGVTLFGGCASSGDGNSHWADDFTKAMILLDGALPRQYPAQEPSQVIQQPISISPPPETPLSCMSVPLAGGRTYTRCQ